jgi:hypothetical protein
MRTDGQYCAEQNVEKDYSDDGGLIKPTEQVPDKY